MDTASQNVTVRFFATLRELFGDEEVVVAVTRASDVARLLDAICDSPLQERGLRQESGGLRKDIVLLVNGRNVAFLGGIDARLKEGDEVAIFPPVYGG